MALRLGIAALACLGLLAGCGSRANDPALTTVRALTSTLFSSGGPQAQPVDPRQVLTRDLIDRAGVPLILVENQTLGTASTLTRIAVNGPNETWQGDDDITVTLSREGVLRATRGYLFDLYSADIEATRQALVQRGGGTAARAHMALRGDVETVLSAYGCEIGFVGSESITIFGRTQSLTRVVEHCVPQAGTDGAPFENRYWIDGTGMAWVSEQYAGPDLGRFRIERLHR